MDSSAGPRSAPSTASTSGPASAAHCPIAANDLDPAMTAAIPTASSPASACRRPRFFRGSGTWARRSRRYWQRAAGIGEDVIGGRASLVAGDGEREELPSFRPGPSAARGHAGRIIRRYDIAGHSLNSRLCRVPGDLLDWAKEFNTQVNKIRYVIEHVIADFKTWRIMHTDYRRPLATFTTTISTVIALYFYAAR